MAISYTSFPLKENELSLVLENITTVVLDLGGFGSDATRTKHKWHDELGVCVLFCILQYV